MLKKSILQAMIFSAVISCASQDKAKENSTTVLPTTSDKIVNSTYPNHKPQKGILRLSEKQNIFLQNQQMNVTFLKTVEDSRCPMNARCIWAGNATVEIELMSTTSRPQKYKLSVGDLRNELVESIDFNGYKFTLEQLYPSNSTDMPFEKLKGKYVIDLKVEKITN